MIDDESQFQGTAEVRERYRFDVERLSFYLQERIDGFQGPLRVKQFKGGQSNPTYLIKSASHHFVLRRKPPGKLLPKAHMVEREFRVMSALSSTNVPVPSTYLCCDDPSIVGTPFFLMEFLDGRIFWTSDLPQVERKDRCAYFEAMNDTIAALHSVDYAAIGLSDYGRPGNYVARQLNVWTRQYRASAIEEIPEMERLIEWLPEALPDNDETAIVHGDFRLDNLVFHPTESRIIGILDWELSTLGHPLVDFAYHCLPYRLPGHVFNGMRGRDVESLGLPSEADYVQRYCRKTGREGIEHLDYYVVFSLFRLAAIAQGIRGRLRDGTAASKQAAQMASYVRPLAVEACALADS
jgi:aminoglycoside phosphotransferase (APT) family kinase protein